MSPSSGPLPESMKAVRVHAYDGRPESIRVENVRVEKPGRGQVTIRVAAAPINPSDLMFLRGRYGLTKPTPAIPGFEGAAGGWRNVGGIRDDLDPAVHALAPERE